VLICRSIHDLHRCSCDGFGVEDSTPRIGVLILIEVVDDAEISLSTEGIVCDKTLVLLQLLEEALLHALLHVRVEGDIPNSAIHHVSVAIPFTFLKLPVFPDKP